MAFYLYSINTGFYINSSGYVGILNSNPQHALDISGTCKAINFTGKSGYLEHLIGIPNSNGTLVCQFNQEAVGDGSVTINGNDMAGYIQMNVQTNKSTAEIKITGFFDKPYSSPPIVIFSPANGQAASIAGLSCFSQNNYFGLVRGSSNTLQDNFPHIWNYIVIGK